MNLLRTFAVLAAIASALLASTPALAREPAGYSSQGRRHHHRRVPELDGTAAASAAVLLGAGVFVILGRRRAKR